MEDFIDYKITQLKGITDLKGGLPEHGATDWWTDQQWKEWNDDMPNKIAWNKQYRQQCIDDGTFGEEYDITITLKYNPIFDSPQLFSAPSLKSYSIVLLNL